MTFKTDAIKEDAVKGAVSRVTHIALFSTAGTATPGTEISGGDYARQACTWNHGAVDGQTTTTVTFSVPAGTTVRGFGLYTAATGGTYIEGDAVPEQPFETGGTYQLTVPVSVGGA